MTTTTTTTTTASMRTDHAGRSLPVVVAAIAEGAAMLRGLLFVAMTRRGAAPVVCIQKARDSNLFSSTRFRTHVHYGQQHRVTTYIPWTIVVCNTWMALASWPARQGQQRSLRRMCQVFSLQLGVRALAGCQELCVGPI
jgi:hypothetical protein